MTTTPSQQRWNIFARVLEDLLHERGLSLGLVDDRAGIHREKVRRIKRSLTVPKSFPVLNPDEMEQVVVTFQFTEHEVQQLRAAILATAIEETLMERIAPADALLAAEQVFGILLQALYRHAGEQRGLAAARNSQVYPEEIDEMFEAALAAIDQGTMALHLSRSAASDLTQLTAIRQAINAFQLALKRLDEMPEPIKASEIWQMWHAEAHQNLAASQQRLAALGETDPSSTNR
jgi:hypothetical protein